MAVDQIGNSTIAGRAQPVTSRRIVSPVLVGRAMELELLVNAVANPSAVAVISGEPGIGKSRLVSELLAHPELSNNENNLLIGRCHRIREPFPLGPVIEALHGIEKVAMRLELSPLCGALRPMLPELHRALPPTPPLLGDPAVERHRVFRALTEVIGSLAQAVVVLEDLHWADDQTVEFVRFLLADPPPRLSLILTYRAEEATTVVQDLSARLPNSTARQDIALQGLTQDETGALAAAILETQYISPEFAAYLRERTSGLPFAIEEVLALLRDRKHVVRRGQRWAHRALDDITVPRAVADSVHERTAHLSADARSIVEAASVLRVPTTCRVVAMTSGLIADRAERPVDEALHSGLLEEVGDLIGVRHVLAAEAIEQMLLGAHKRALHERAADALEEVGAASFGRRAHHLRLAGKLDAWARCAEQAADHAAHLGDDSQATRLLKDVLVDAPLEPAARARVALKLGHSALHSLAHDDVLEVLRTTLQEEHFPECERGELRLSLALLLSQRGDIHKRDHQTRQAIVELEHRPELMARAMSVFVLPHGFEAPVVENAAWMRRALETLDRVEDPVVKVAVLGDSASLQVAMGDGAWQRTLERIPRRANSREQEREIERVIHNAANNATYVGHFSTARTLVEEGLARAERLEYERMMLFFRARRAVLDYRMGHWEGLASTVDSLSEDLADVRCTRAEVRGVSGGLSLAGGDLQEAQQRLERVLDVVEEVQMVYELAPTVGALTRIHLSREDYAAALENSVRCTAVLQAKGLWTLAGPAAPGAVEALLRCAGRAKAEILVGQFAEGLTGRDAPGAHAALRLCRGIIAEAVGSRQAAAEDFLAAAHLYERLPSPYEAAQAKERAALCLFGSSTEAGGQILLDALHSYKQLGATWDVDRCTRAARANGLSLPKPYRGGRKGYGAALTPRELEVAQLAAGGLSNKEIAQELFLSPRTAENHLSRVLAKLKVRSRAAIAGRLQQMPEN